MNKIQASITAVNAWVPDYVLTNKEMEAMVDTNDEWIQSRTGIRERRILKGEGLGSSDIAVPAVEGLLKKRGINADEIELLICATTTPDFVFPATANVICDKIGAKNAWGYDISATLSFLPHYYCYQLCDNKFIIIFKLLHTVSCLMENEQVFLF